MGTYVGRYKPIAVGAVASYDTMDEQAALFITKVNAATHADALPDVSTGATAKWVGVQTVAAASTAGATSTYKDDTVITDGVVHLRVTAPDVDSTANVAAVADAIDQAVTGTLTVDGAMASAETTTFNLHAGQGTILAAILAVDGFCYLKVGDEGEIIKVTDLDTLAVTCVRGALSSTPSATWDDDEPLYHYCGPDNTVIGLDDPSVWGTPDHLVVICGTEQMLVDVDSIDDITDCMEVTRGYDGTTAAAHADNAAVTQYIDEATTQFDVNDGALLKDEAFYKVETGGTEVIQVKSISTNRITVERAQNNSPEAVIGGTANLFRVWGPEIYDAALTAVNGTATMPDFEEYGGPPVNTLGYNAAGSAAWSSETQADAT